MALQAGISPETLRKIERGRIPTPAFFTVVAVAEVLELSLDGLLAQLSPPGTATGTTDVAATDGAATNEATGEAADTPAEVSRSAAG